MYYSPSQGGFYSEDIHGPLNLSIPDPDWTPVAGEEAPLISIPNPDCKIPGDAVFVTDEDYQALLAAQGAGKHIVADSGGSPVAIDPQLSPDAIIKSQILALEATVTQRRLREAILGTDGGWLSAQEAQIATLRSQLD